MNFSWYASITAWYSAVSALTSVHAMASSMPVAPPKEIFTSPPCLRSASIWSPNALVRGSNALNQLALQPALLTNAIVNALTPPLAASWARVGLPGLDSRPMSTYGATRMPLAGLGAGAGAVFVAVAVAVGFGAGALGSAVGGCTGGAPAPVAHGAPLIVHPAGAPLPVTMNPKLVAEAALSWAL